MIHLFVCVCVVCRLTLLVCFLVFSVFFHSIYLCWSFGCSFFFLVIFLLSTKTHSHSIFAAFSLFRSSPHIRRHYSKKKYILYSWKEETKQQKKRNNQNPISILIYNHFFECANPPPHHPPSLHRRRWIQQQQQQRWRILILQYWWCFCVNFNSNKTNLGLFFVLFSFFFCFMWCV